KICLGPDRDRGIVDGLLQIGDAPVANIGFGDTGRRQTTLLVIRYLLGGGAARQLAAVETTACDAKPALPAYIALPSGRTLQSPLHAVKMRRPSDEAHAKAAGGFFLMVSIMADFGAVSAA